MDELDFIYQAGALRRVERSGWKTIGISPESVSEHSYRAAIIAYILAKKEGVDPEKAALAALFHDLHEVRINDIHIVGKKYLRIDEKKAREDTLAPFPEILSLLGDERIMRIAGDADRLELIFQAKEYRDLGNGYVQEWIERASALLKTESARRMAGEALKRDAFAWLFEARR
ncbi:MAG: HD domain-containing protein [Candidatus Micrarchaeota archaeon]